MMPSARRSRDSARRASSVVQSAGSMVGDSLSVGSMGSDDLRERVADELLAARPHARAIRAYQQLRANAVPLPLGLPVVDGSERRGIVLQRMREEERIRPVRGGAGLEAHAAQPVDERR